MKLRRSSSYLINMVHNGECLKLISRIGTNYFTFRSTNSIKNRFYTALRNTFKLVFRNHENIDWKFPYEIPSKDLVRLYQGR